MNRNLMLQEEKKVAEDSSRLEKIISAALTEEKQKNENYKKQIEKLTKDINYCVEQIKSNEAYIQKLQQDNSRLKKDLIDFGQKHEAEDYIDKIKLKEIEIQKILEEKSNLARDWDDLRDKMEEILKENRVLRQIADVPENFGIDISKINMGDRIKIEQNRRGKFSRHGRSDRRCPRRLHGISEQKSRPAPCGLNADAEKSR